MKTIKLGSKGSEVKILQEKLHLTSDGIFGKLTQAAVIKFQNENGLAPDGIVGTKTWAKLGVNDTPAVSASQNFPITGCPPITNRRITEIIVHCEATPEGEDFTPEQVNASHKARNFTSYIRNGRKWYIGYHYVIQLDGTIIPCRPESVIGCHCSGHNKSSIGISYVGGCPPRTDKNWMRKGKDTRTPAQKESMLKLLKELKAKYPIATIYGHRDFANKACPSFDARTEYKDL